MHNFLGEGKGDSVEEGRREKEREMKERLLVKLFVVFTDVLA